jgi:hypothetical protein
MQQWLVVLLGLISIFYTFFPHMAHVWVAKTLTGRYYFDIPHQAHVAFGVGLGLFVLWSTRSQNMGG